MHGDTSQISFCDRIVFLVEQIPALLRQLADAKTPNDKTAIQRMIETIDTQIDRLAYELYGLTEEEISIVESNAIKT